MSDNNGGSRARRTPKVCVLTSVHPPFDTRIFHREAVSLSEMGYEVHLVAPSNQDDVVKGVHVHAVQPADGRRWRMTRTARDVYRCGLKLGADVYHFHDPELIPFGILLKLHGKRVIYDVHEDVPKDILVKTWIASWLRKPVALTAGAVEQLAARFLDRVITATSTVARRFPPQKTAVVQNFPPGDSLWNPDAVPYPERRSLVAYVGGIAEIRGAREMVMAISMVPEHLQARLALAGPWDSLEFATELNALPGWSRTDYQGVLSRDKVRDLLADSRIGLVVLHPTSAYLEAQPTKLYEYMSAGIPVVASNYPLLREIVEGHGCGLSVDPMDPEAIAQAIQWLLQHPQEAEEMGKRGRQVVLQRYNWEQEAVVLRNVYQELLKD
jgi:glycosyltransferase involved in cell wall biosynthesis